MIKTFRSKKLKRLFETGVAQGLPADQVSRIENRLAILDTARAIEDCNVAGFKLHSLKGDYKGFHSVWVSGNWRIVFRFVSGDVYDVDHVDYH